jgi:hypothetical protein
MNLKRVLVCTIATHETEGLAAMKKSCEKCRIPMVLCGWGQEYRGASWRLKILYEQLLQQKRKYDYVLLIDGFDSVFTAGLGEIMRKYAAMNTRFLMSAETNCWPPFGPSPDDYPPAPTRYRFVNSGGYIGRVDYLIRVMTELGVPEMPDFQSDQHLWADVYVSGKTEMKLDHYCQIFQCLWDAHGDLTYEERIYNHLTGSYPCIIHGNGRTDMARVNQVVLKDRL